MNYFRSIPLFPALVLAAALFLIAGCGEGAPVSSSTSAQNIQSYDSDKAKAAGLRNVTANFAVAPQIEVGDLGRIKDAGFTRIINHRPEGEGAGQPKTAAIAAEAKRLGLKFVDLPFRSGHVTPQAFDGLVAELTASDEPTLSYCRSGTRAVTIWSMAQVKSGAMTPDQAIAAAAGAGYRLQGNKAELEQLAH